MCRLLCVSFQLLCVKSTIVKSYTRYVFSFIVNCQTVFQNCYLDIFVFLQTMNEHSSCSTPWAAFGVLSVLDCGLSNRCVVESRFCFNLHFPGDTYCGALFFFHMITYHLYNFYGMVSVHDFGQFLKLGCLFSYGWVLSILHTFLTLLCQRGLLQMFSPSLWLIFLFSWYFFLS